MRPQQLIEDWVARIIAAIASVRDEQSGQTLLRHIKGIRAHLIGFLDEIEKLLLPEDPGKQ